MAKTKAKQDTAKGKTFSTADLAEELGIESKALRVWLRSQKLGVGRGKQYKFTQKQADKILKDYTADE